MVSGLFQSNRRLCSRNFGPGPGVAEPEVRHQVQLSGFRSAIDGLDADANILRTSFRIFDEDVEVAVFIEDSGIQQFVLAPTHLSPAPPIFFN